MAEPMIMVKGLKKQFGEVNAVAGIDLMVSRGEMFGMVGPDGAGKTTTIKMLCGIVEPDGGEGQIMGFDFRKERHLIKQHIGYLSQKFSLYGDLTVDENIEFFAQINGVAHFKTRRDELLEFTRLKEFRKRFAGNLSGGMKQKLALACTLIHTPELIFLDEPTTGVDPVSRRDFWKILFNLLKERITIVLTTPYLDEAERCTRIALVDNGKVLVLDSFSGIQKLMTGVVVEVVCDQIRRANQLLSGEPFVREAQTFGDRLNVVVQQEGDLDKLAPILARQGIMVSDVRIIPPSLENVFISMVSH